jgi:hypothetical protein
MAGRTKEVDAQAAGPGPSVQVSYEGLEIAQAIQEPRNSVTLIAGKVTVIRLYLGGPANVRVRGTLNVQIGTGATFSVPSLNEIAINPALNNMLDVKRRDMSRSLNFLLPPQTTVVGAATFRIASIVDPTTGTTAVVSSAVATTGTFVAGAPLRLRLLGIRYQNATGTKTAVATQRDVDLIFSWLRRAYPIPLLNATYAIVNAAKRWPFAATDINAQLAAIRRQDIAAGTDRRTHYFGVVSDAIGFMRGRASAIPATADPSAVASGPTGAVGYAWDTDGSYGDWYTGHELGHTFGRMHPGFCGETHDDSSYPYRDGQLADGASLKFVGVDCGDTAASIALAALPGEEWHDVMTYCDKQWVSAYTYEAIRTRLLAEDALGAGTAGIGIAPGVKATGMADTSGFVNVVATLNLSAGTGVIQYVNPVPPEAGDEYDVPQDGSAALRARNHAGAIVEEIRVPYRMQSCAEDEPRTALIDAVVRMPHDVATLSLIYEGREVDTFRRGQRLSRVFDVRAREGGVEQGKTIVWESAEAEDPAITYSVQISRDAGETWETIATGIPDPAVTVDPADYPGTAELRVRVMATDGFDVTDFSESTVPLL